MQRLPVGRFAAEEIGQFVLGSALASGFHPPLLAELHPPVGQVVVRVVRPTLAVEYLHQEGMRVSKETLRQWMIAEGLWQAGKPRKARLHPPRARRPRLGELVQIDGSLHDWFEGRGRRCVLIAFKSA